MRTEVEASIEIEAPPADVWRLLHDPLWRPLWDVRIARAVVLSASPLAAGSRVRYWLRLGWGLRLPLDGEYTLYREPQRCAIRFDVGSRWQLLRHAAGCWRLEPTSHGTLFTSRFVYELRGGAGCRWLDQRWFAASVQRDTERSLARLAGLFHSPRWEPSAGPADNATCVDTVDTNHAACDTLRQVATSGCAATTHDFTPRV